MQHVKGRVKRIELNLYPYDPIKCEMLRFIERKRSLECAAPGLQIFQIYYENCPFHNHQNRLFGHSHSCRPKQFEIQGQYQFPCLYPFHHPVLNNQSIR